MTSLILNGFDISNLNATSYSQIYRTNAGYSTGYNTQLFFYINMRTLLGEDFDKYDVFEIELLHYSQSFKTSSNLTLNGDVANDAVNNYRFLSFKLTGLEFINSFYNNDIIANYLLNTNSGVTETRYFTDQKLVFRKGDPNVTLGIQIWSTYLNIPIPSSYFNLSNRMMPVTSYLFKITGIPRSPQYS